MNNKLLIGGVIGGIAFFILGYLIYMLALGTTLEAHTMPGVNRGADVMLIHIFLGSLAFGFALSYILTKSNTYGFGNGATTGLISGLLIGLGFDMIMYGNSKIMTDMTGLFIDVIGFTIMWALVGGILGAYFTMGRAKG